MAAYEVEVNISVPLVFAVYYVVYWAFFIVLADRLAARNKWLALIPGIKVYLLRKMSGKEYKTGRSLTFFLLCFFTWLGGLPVVAQYSSSGLLPNLVFWGGILAYLLYRGAMLASIAGRLGEPAWKAYLYGVPLVGFVFITIAAFSPRQTIHEQQRTKQLRARVPALHRDHEQIHRHGQQPPRQHQRYPHPHGYHANIHEGGICSLCGELNPPGFSECRNCGNSLSY